MAAMGSSGSAQPRQSPRQRLGGRSCNGGGLMFESWNGGFSLMPKMLLKLHKMMVSHGIEHAQNDDFERFILVGVGE